MSCSRKTKIKLNIPKEELPKWLRDLAQALEAGEMNMPEGSVCLEGHESLKLTVKSLGSMLKLKLGLKFPKVRGLITPGEEGQAQISQDQSPGAIRYKSLKKQMKHGFKAMGLALANNNMPPQAEALSFMADARLMTTYPGKGDEFYLAFLEKVSELENALANQDLPAVKSAYADLTRLKHDCHERHA